MNRAVPGTGRGDDGITLIEVMVAMVVMAVVMIVFTTATIQIYRSTNQVQGAADAASQINIAYIRLDKEIRYATAISSPSTTGDPEVEYLTTFTGTPTCTELRVQTLNGIPQLRWRSWPQSATDLTSYTFVTLVAGVVAPSGAAPFTVTPDSPVDPNAASTVQQLEVRLAAASSPGRQIDISFTALNSNATLSSATACSLGRSYP